MLKDFVHSDSFVVILCAKSFLFFYKGENNMQNNSKKIENYYPNRTYENHAGAGTILVKKKAEVSDGGVLVINDETVSAEEKIGQCFNRASVSTRKVKKGYVVVVTRQPGTTEEAYELAKQFQAEAKAELEAHDCYADDFDGFTSWFSEKEIVLKDNGFHKLKD